MANDLTGAPDLATGGTTGAVEANPYLDILQADQRAADTKLRANLATAVTTSPPAFAAQQRAAQTLGYPTAAVEAAPHLEQQAQVQDITQSIARSPVLQQAYSDPAFAKLAHGDHGVLAALQDALLYAVGGQGTGVGEQGGIQNAAAPTAAGDMVHALGASAAKLVKPAYVAVGAAPVLFDKARSAVTGQDTTEAGDAYFARTVAPLDAFTDGVSLGADSPFHRKAVQAVGDLVGTLTAVMATGGAAEAPAAGAGMLSFLRGALAHTTKSMALPATADAVNTYQGVLAAGGSANDAAKAAATSFGTTVLAGMVPLSMEGGLATRAATGFAAGAVSGEATRQAMNAVLPDTMQTEFRPDDTVLQGLTGMALAGVMGPRAAPDFHAAVRKTYTDAVQVADAEDGAARIQSLSELAQASELRKHDPETFKQTIAQMAEDPDAVKAVFIKGEELDKALEAGGVTVDQLRAMMPHVADQLAEARGTGGDVRIPVEDFATHIAGGKLEQSLTPHLRATADGLTLTEAQALAKENADALKDGAGKLVEQTGEGDEREQELQTLHDHVLDQINSTGRYRPEVAKSYAALTRAYYDTTAERLGTTPAELFMAHPLNVDAISGARPGEGLRQDVNPRQLRTVQAGELVDGRTVRADVPNRSSVGASLDNYETLPGIREVPLSAFDTEYIDSIRNGKLDARTQLLADQIDKSRELNPLIVAFDDKGAYVIEGAHRFDALIKSGAKSLPAEVVLDHDSGAVFNQGDTAPRGEYSPASNTITLLHDADLSTYLHELGHHFLETHARLAAGEGAHPDIVADVHALIGETPAAEWLTRPLDERRAKHEEFARSFEAYLMEGKAPSMELQGLFSRFRSWLVNAYHSITSLGVDLTPEVRGVMDRMLASDTAIEEAERTRGMLSMDAPPDGATDKQFAAYREAGAAATAEGKSAMLARSIRDMRWLSNAKSAAMRALQKEGKAARKDTQAAVAAQVREMPAYKAKAFLAEHDAEQADAAAKWERRREKEVEDAARASKKLKAGRAAAAAEQRVTEWEAKHPRPADGPALDMEAEQRGFANAADMRDQVARAESEHELVEGLTDQRMLEEHGELTDERAIERAAEAAIHNDARARFMATGLKLLTKSPVSPAQLAKAAKEAAQTAVNGKAVKDLSPSQYAAAEKRANRDVLKLAPKDVEGAAKAQREALLNNALFRAALQAQTDVQKGLDYLGRFSKPSTRGKVALDVRDQIDALLDRFDLRKSQPEDGRQTRAQQNLENWIAAQQAAGYNPSVSRAALDPTVRQHYTAMTVEEFKGLVDSVKALEAVGRQRQTITIEGERMELDAFVQNDLVPKLAERGERFTADELLDRPEVRHPDNPVRVALDHLQSWMRQIAAQLKPQEFKRNQYDRHELLGPMGRGIFDPVINAAYHKVDMLRGLSDDFGALAKELGRPWQDSMHDQIANVTLPDPDRPGKMMRLTRGRMVGIALHVGNESNFDKLTKGWGWKPEEVLRFLSKNMTVADWRATQHVWDLYEKHWPDTEAMYRRLGQTIPEKIAARPFTVTGADGAEVALRGGYAAITYDALRSRRGERASSGEAIDPADGLFGRGYFSRKTTTNGSMNARVEGYTDRVDLDFHNIGQVLQETIHDLAYRETLMDVNKILEHPEFKSAFRSAYGREAHQSMREWIGNLANAQNQDRQVGAFGKFLRYSRTGMVINAIALRATTVLKHGGSAGFKTLGYMAGGGEKYFASRVASMSTDFRAQIAGAREKFPEIRARLMQQDRDFRATSLALFEPDSKLAQAERFGHAAVAWADMMTAVPTAWAAYDRAITEGIPKTQGGTGQPMTEEQAVNYANKIVREAHGSQNEAGRSMIMSSNSEAVKMFTTLYGFMNTGYGQQLDSIDKLNTKGISAAPVLARTLMAIVVPSLWAAALTHGLPDKDKDEGWLAWTAKALGGEVASSVPGVRDAVAMFEGFSHAGQVSAESWISAMVQPIIDARNVMRNPDAHPNAIKDVANAVGMGLHIPGLGQLGTSAQYVYNVATGKEQPESAFDAAMGVVKGHGGH